MLLTLYGVILAIISDQSGCKLDSPETVTLICSHAQWLSIEWLQPVGHWISIGRFRNGSDINIVLRVPIVWQGG